MSYFISNICPFFQLAQYCNFDVNEPREWVLKVNKNDWLIASPEEYTTYIKCKNDTYDVYISHLTKLHVPPRCSVELKIHSLHTGDEDQKINVEVKHFEWNFSSKDIFPESDETELDLKVKSLIASGQKLFQSTDLKNLKIGNNIASTGIHGMVAGYSGFAFLLVLVICYIVYKKCIKSRSTLNPLDLEANCNIPRPAAPVITINNHQTDNNIHQEGLPAYYPVTEMSK